MPVSSTSIAAMNSRTLRSTSRPVPSSVSGISTVVRSTRNTEMPSTPVLKCVPSAGIHSMSNTSWKPSAFGLK
jgi:hypothetical protein